MAMGSSQKGEFNFEFLGIEIISSNKFRKNNLEKTRLE
jgi:hypothetical protein